MFKMVALLLVTFITGVVFMPSSDPDQVFRVWAMVVLFLYALDDLVKRFFTPPTSDARLSKLVKRVTQVEQEMVNINKDFNAQENTVYNIAKSVEDVTNMIDRLVAIVRRM